MKQYQSLPPGVDIAVMCDKCGVSMGGKLINNDRALSVETLRRDALAAGWTGEMRGDRHDDRCPRCSKTIILPTDFRFNPRLK